MEMEVKRASQAQLSASSSSKIGNLRAREALSSMLKLNEERWITLSVRFTVGQKWAGKYINISKRETMFIVINSCM